MPAQKQYKTNYPGVRYINGKAIGANKPEKIYYITYRKAGKLINEKAGRQFQDDMTPARASHLRAERIQGAKSNSEKREAEEARKKTEAGKWTINKLFNEYIQSRPDNKSRKTDAGRYKKYIQPVFCNKEPQKIAPLEVDRLRLRLKKKLAPQTVKHVLNLLTWITSFGVKKGLCKGLSFHVQKPVVNNIKTEDLTPGQLSRLLKVLETESNVQAANLMKMALFTGMRRGELFKLRWKDIDFEKGFINIRSPKGGVDQKIPLNNEARAILEGHVRTGSEYIFPGQNGGMRITVRSAANKIKKRAGLPKDFRPLHGLRHVYASMLASSGKVDIVHLAKIIDA
ncbi:hypothetical protein BuS5_01931 [Desulfosarcina sp. BuS5]|uniref:tyrosine-type recombinase/integrase n=1 Tax=Desulfosarcina sp. BuS5 TaxID=933262 RepID=UPI000A4383F0|nr:site-specific integrase [Desulfosarcina sp. BuS5]WDN88963.1 hypothetical protein BuS5_01931 [Desulfosarcina sp. BuS5]